MRCPSRAKPSSAMETLGGKWNSRFSVHKGKGILRVQVDKMSLTFVSVADTAAGEDPVLNSRTRPALRTPVLSTFDLAPGSLVCWRSCSLPPWVRCDSPRWTVRTLCFLPGGCSPKASPWTAAQRHFFKASLDVCQTKSGLFTHGYIMLKVYKIHRSSYLTTSGQSNTDFISSLKTDRASPWKIH